MMMMLKGKIIIINIIVILCEYDINPDLLDVS